MDKTREKESLVDQDKIEALWIEVANKRDQEIEDGTVTAIPGEEV